MENIVYVSGRELCGLESLINAAYDRMNNGASHEEMAALLYYIKFLCITHGIKRPPWWYSFRNRMDFIINIKGGFVHGYDLSGF